eukprot:g75632.t1
MKIQDTQPAKAKNTTALCSRTSEKCPFTHDHATCKSACYFIILILGFTPLLLVNDLNETLYLILSTRSNRPKSPGLGPSTLEIVFSKGFGKPSCFTAAVCNLLYKTCFFLGWKRYVNPESEVVLCCFHKLSPDDQWHRSVGLAVCHCLSNPLVDKFDKRNIALALVSKNDFCDLLQAIHQNSQRLVTKVWNLSPAK